MSWSAYSSNFATLLWSTWLLKIIFHMLYRERKTCLHKINCDVWVAGDYHSSSCPPCSVIASREVSRLAVNCCPMYAMSMCRGVREKDSIRQMILIPNLWCSIEAVVHTWGTEESPPNLSQRLASCLSVWICHRHCAWQPGWLFFGFWLVFVF